MLAIVAAILFAIWGPTVQAAHNGYRQSHRCPADRQRQAPGPASLRAFPATGKRTVD